MRRTRRRRRRTTMTMTTTTSTTMMMMCTEHDASVAYVDDDDEDDPSIPLYQTMPYACGKVLLASVLDSLVAAVSILLNCAQSTMSSFRY